MTNFTCISINGQELAGKGNIQKSGDLVTIDTNDSHVMRFFRTMQRNRGTINNIGFNEDSIYAGNYIVLGIDTNGTHSIKMRKSL